ncbi:MAG: energy transducer TonB [Smithella sp.]
MNYQTRAFQISFLIHSVILAVVVICNTLMPQYKKAVALDFHLLTPVPAVRKVEPLERISFIKTRLISSTVHQNLKKKESQPQSKESSRTSNLPEAQLMAKLPESLKQESNLGVGVPDQVKDVKEGSSGISKGKKGGLGINPGSGNSDSGKESARAKYLNDHFAYIRNKILRNISYPDAARRMGWQGKVLLSFIIKANGSVKGFNIIQSSGFTVLDKDAIETVKDTAPFPKPPAEAQLVIPIIYRLE